MLKAELSLPARPDIEKLVLGSVLAGYCQFDVVSSALEIDDFSVEVNRRIYRRAGEVYARGETVDRITVFDELLKHSEHESVGGLSYLIGLDEGLPQFPNLDSYLKILRDQSVLRRTILTCDMIQKQCFSEGDAAPILQRAEFLLANLAEPVSTVTLMTPEEIKLNAPGGINGFMDPSSVRGRGVPSPWGQLTNLLPALRGGQLVILAARPSVGKTIAVCQWAHFAAASGFPAVVFSLEMSREEILGRMTCARASVDSHRYFSGYLNREERARFARSSAAIDTLPLRVDDSTAVTAPGIHSAIRRFNAKGQKIRLAVIDYLGLMEAAGKLENRVLEITQITRGLKRMARELDVAVLVACQLNRAAVGEEPQLHHLRESGSIEQDADIVMFLHPANERQEDRGQRVETQLIVAKQRNGPKGSARLELDPGFVRFNDPRDPEVVWDGCNTNAQLEL